MAVLASAVGVGEYGLFEAALEVVRTLVQVLVDQVHERRHAIGDIARDAEHAPQHHYHARTRTG